MTVETSSAGDATSPRPASVRAAVLRAREEGRCALIPYLTMGFPDLDTSLELVHAIEAMGVDAVEIGVPFSDPVADGPTIQRTTDHALAQGVTLRSCLQGLAQVPAEKNVARILFSYLNPLLAFGFDALPTALAAGGVGSVLVTDMIPEEAGEWNRVARERGVETCYLVAPTSTDARLRLVAETSTGFVYCVSTLGVTGVRSTIDDAARVTVQRVRAVTDAPVAVGFGIKGPEDVRAVREYADGAVIGSALMNAIDGASGRDDVIARAQDFLGPVLDACRA